MAHLIKLQRKDTTRIRVRDLAREVGAPPADVVGYIRSLGEYVASSSAYVEAPIARRARGAFMTGTPARAPIRHPSTAPSVTRADRHVQASAGAGQHPFGASSNIEPADGHVQASLSAPRQLPRRDNHPMMDASPNLPTSPAMDDSAESSPQRTRDMAIVYRTASPLQESDQDYSAAGAFRPSETFRYLEWAVRGISEPEREVWLAHGLGSTHARIAAECNNAEIRPQDLGVVVNGFTILDRVLHGESPRHVARLWHLQRTRDVG